MGVGGYGIWRGEFEGKSIGIPMGIGESVTWGVVNTVSDGGKLGVGEKL